MADVDFHWSEYIKTGSEAFILLKSLYPLLPTAQSKNELEAKILAAEDALKKADVALAIAWGFNMLWNESIKERVCPGCGHTTNFNQPLPPSGRSWAASRRG
jgi:hypothetical protein